MQQINDYNGYYAVLEIPPTATQDEIKSAYRLLARKFHPDLNKSEEAEQKFVKIQEAYDILSDTQKRKNYDRQSAGRSNFSSYYADLADFFRSAGQPNFNGIDVKKTVVISLEEVCSGTVRGLEIPTNTFCETCQGNGCKADRTSNNCSSCGGLGFVQRYRMQNGVQIEFRSYCVDCEGKGKVILDQDRCSDCNGIGLKNSSKVVMMTIPQGIKAGSRLVRNGEGMLGVPNGRRGSLVIEIGYKPHDIFQYRNGQLILEFPITFSQATTGVDIKIPTFYGEKNLQIPAGVEIGAVFYVKNCGLMNSDGSKNPLLVKIYYTIPKLTIEYDSLLSELRSLENEINIPDYFKNTERIKEYINGKKEHKYDEKNNSVKL